jgi:CubicO group peptidase (beta-lactamase class C family)
MKKTVGLLSLVIISFFANTAAGHDRPQDAVKLVDAVFAEWDRWDSPGAALAVIKDGEVVYKRGYGIANMEYAVPITPETIFHVASVSKQFTAFAIDLLAEEGKLSLDDDIRKYLPDLPDFGKTITIRHLLHHTSGLRDQWELLAMAGWRLDDVITTEQILKTVRHQKDLNFEPGAEYLYCNTGYTLMAEIVEKVTGRSFREWTEENIFKPLGMTRTHFHDDHEEIVPGRAYSYEKADGGFKISVLSYATVGATSLFTTVEDLARWVNNFEEARVGGPAVQEAMRRKGVLNSGKEIPYAHGILVEEYRGQKTISHSGGDAGFRSYLVFFPDQRFGVVILSNLAELSPSELAYKVADIYLADRLGPAKPELEMPKVSEIDTSVFDDFLGRYRLAEGRLLRIFSENGTINLQIMGRSRVELLPESETQLFIKDSGIRLSFQRDDTGKVVKLLLRLREGTELTGEKVDTEAPSIETLNGVTGNYYSEELGTTYTIVLRDGVLTATHRRHEDIHLSFFDTDLFIGDKWWFAKAELIRNDKGEVCGLHLTGGRVRNLRFDKESP